MHFTDGLKILRQRASDACAIENTHIPEFEIADGLETFLNRLTTSRELSLGSVQPMPQGVIDELIRDIRAKSIDFSQSPYVIEGDAVDTYIDILPGEEGQVDVSFFTTPHTEDSENEDVMFAIDRIRVILVAEDPSYGIVTPQDIRPEQLTWRGLNPDINHLITIYRAR